MYLCYIDESGTPDIPGNSSQYVLAGLSIPIWHWKSCDREIYIIKKRYGLGDEEIHVAWMLRKYGEQDSISDFDSLDYAQRRSAVSRIRTRELLRLQRSGNSKLYHQTKKNYRKTEAYIHLNYDERKALLLEVARCVGSWGFARLFAECVDKVHFDPSRAPLKVDEQAFEQVVSRFERYLQNFSTHYPGLLIHDNNDTVADRHTKLMMKFHRRGTFWTEVKCIIETPLFVNSQLTSMVQISDLCAYALRRYIENKEEELFDLIFQRADRRFEVVVGVRHFADRSCDCKICDAHKPRAVAEIVVEPSS